MVWLMKLKELADRVLGEDQRAKHLREEELQLAAAALLVRHLPFDLHAPRASCPPLPCRDCELRQHAPRGDDAGAGPPNRGLGLCSDPEAPPARRDAMAVAAAPYVHSKLPQVDGTPHHKQTITSV